MGRRGRAPEPTALKILKGNPGKQALNRNEPEPRDVEPEMPEFLGEVAVAEWNRVVPLLRDMGLLKETDGPTLAAYCQAYQTWRETAEDIRENGLTMTHQITGVPHANPAVAMMQRALNQIRQFSQEFGMTPSARSRMVVSLDKSEKDPLEEMLG